MNQDIVLELRFFITSILWGVFLLVIYDTLRILRRIIKHNTFFTAMGDILYWMISSVLIFRMMYRQNNGIIRGFAIGAIIIGMLLYHGSVSDLIVNTISNFILGIISIIKKTISFLFYVLFTPFRLLGKLLKKVFSPLYRNIKKLIHFLLKSLKKKRKASKIETIEKEEEENSKNL